jgi:hypothetical protein
MCCNMRLAKAKKCLRGATIRALTKKNQLAETQLQGDPTNEEVRDILSHSQVKLENIYQNQVSRNQHLSSTNWFRYDDTCSKAFSISIIRTEKNSFKRTRDRKWTGYGPI